MASSHPLCGHESGTLPADVKYGDKKCGERAVESADKNEKN